MSSFYPKDYIQKFFKVEAKEAVDGNKIIPFKLNAAQAELDHSTLMRKMHVILKARQLGISTYVTARFLAKCISVNGTHAAVVSHEKQATIRLLRRAHFFLDQMKKDDIVIPTEYENKAEITFPKTNSSLYIGTAGQKSFSRGDMLSDFHGSEIAFWPEPEKIMTGVTGALTGDAEVFLESTANGMGGFFFDVCKESGLLDEQASEDAPYLKHFYPWYIDEGYQRDVKLGTMWSPEETWLGKKFNLTDRQLAWRRWKMAQYKSVEEFMQEFPMTPEEAFIVTGTCYFDKMSLRGYLRQCKDPDSIGRVELIGQEARFIRGEKGPLRIWQHPRPMIDYLISVDCSEGIEADGTDYTYANVLDRERFCQAAVLRGKLDPNEAAEKLYALGKLYHWAVLAVEDNGPGLAVLMRLRELGYPRMYTHRRIEEIDGNAKESHKIGWHTDQRTRPLILAELRTAIKNQSYGVRDKILVQESTTFCKQKDGTWKANSGCHDDSVMANAIGLYLHKQIPYLIPEDTSRFGSFEQREVVRHGNKTGY